MVELVKMHKVKYPDLLNQIVNFLLRYLEDLNYSSLLHYGALKCISQFGAPIFYKTIMPKLHVFAQNFREKIKYEQTCLQTALVS